MFPSSKKNLIIVLTTTKYIVPVLENTRLVQYYVNCFIVLNKIKKICEIIRCRNVDFSKSGLNIQ